MTNQQQNFNGNVSDNGVYDIPKQKKKIKKRWIILGIIALVVLAGFINSKMDDVKEQKEKNAERHQELKWPKDSALAQMLPTPDAKYGEVSNDSSDYLSVYIYDMNKKEFQEYVSKCKDEGFTVNYSGSDTHYSAENNNGYELMLSYSDYDGEEVKISVSTIDDENDQNSDEDKLNNSDDTISDSSDKPNENNNDKSNTDKNDKSNSDSSDKDNKSDSGVSPDFKKAMDSYEKTIDDYVKFMKKYSESDNSLSMAADYAKYFKQYTDTMEKLDNIDEDSLSDEDLAYYIKVSGRITEKLADVVTQ